MTSPSRAGLFASLLPILACSGTGPAAQSPVDGAGEPAAADSSDPDAGPMDARPPRSAGPTTCALDAGAFCLTDPPFRGVWQDGPDDVWILRSDFQEVSVHHWDGATWTAHATGAADLSALWGSASNDIWAVGAAGSIVHWDGSQFAPVSSGSDAALAAVWGSGPGDVWAVGTSADSPPQGVTLHWNGAAWSVVSCCAGAGAASVDLRAVGGSGAGDVWIAGQQVSTADATRSPYALHWDGAAWSPVAMTGSGFGLTAVWSSGPADVWFGAETQILHYDGQSFATSKSGIVGAIAAIGGGGPGDVWAVRPRGGILRWDGATWSSTASGTVNDLAAVSGSGAADAWTVGPAGTVLHWDGASWTPVADGSTGPLEALWGISDQDLWTSGPLHGDGASWAADQTGSSIPALDLCGFDAGDVWAVGINLQNGLDIGFVAHFAAGTWTILGIDRVYVPYSGLDQTLGPSSLRALWCHTPSDIWAVGQMQGIVGDVVMTIAHWDGNLWSPVPTPSTWDLNGVWGSGADDVWAAGSSGTLMHWDGSAWASVPSGTSADLGAVWGSGAGDVWVVMTGQSQLLHWDGVEWSFVASGTTNPHLAHIWGTGSGDAWAVGGDTTGGVVTHFDGSAWSTAWSAPAPVGRLSAIWGSASTLWVVAENGMIFTRDR